MLVVIQPFASYKRGDKITDPSLSAIILATEDARNVIAVGTPGVSPPAPAQKTLVELLEDIANNGGGGALPQLIDALPDAEGNPPAGYEWLPGASAQKNYGCALTDFNTFSAGPGIPCGTGWVSTGDEYAAGSGTFSISAVRSATNARIDLFVSVPIDALNAALVAADIVSDTTLFVVYKVQAADGTWTLQSGFTTSDGTLTTAGSTSITAGYEDYVGQQALAKFGGYYVYAVPSLTYFVIDISTGTIYSDLDSRPANTPNYPWPRGNVIAGDPNGLYIRSAQAPVLLYVPMSIAVVAGRPALTEASVTVVMPVPGSVAGTILPNGRIVLCTRAGFFEVQSTPSGVRVQQTAGVHPLITLTTVTTYSAIDDVRALWYDATSGLLHTISAHYEIVVDYTTLKSLFVRKAHLITA